MGKPWEHDDFTKIYWDVTGFVCGFMMAKLLERTRWLTRGYGTLTRVRWDFEATITKLGGLTL